MFLVRKAKALFEKYKSDKFLGVDLHIKYMIKYGLSKPQPNSFDKTAYEVACWLHDIGRYHPEDDLKYRRKHHVLGAKVYDKRFANYVKNTLRSEKIRLCIFEHSGIKPSKNYPEIKTIQEADRVSFMHPAFIKTGNQKRQTRFSR